MSLGNKKYFLPAKSIAASLVTGTVAAQAPPLIAHAPPVKDDGTITVPSFDLPFSSFASQQARDSFVHRLRNPSQYASDIVKMRQMSDEKLKPQFEKSKALYPFTSTKSKMGGVPVETFRHRCTK
jgi:hypothetical protein